MTTHLWWNGYDHMFGETAEDASLNARGIFGLSVEEADGDGWQMVPDDAVMRTEEDPPGYATGETASEFAESMRAAHEAADPQDPAAPSPGSGEGAP